MFNNVMITIILLIIMIIGQRSFLSHEDKKKRKMCLRDMSRIGRLAILEMESEFLFC